MMVSKKSGEYRSFRFTMVITDALTTSDSGAACSFAISTPVRQSYSFKGWRTRLLPVTEDQHPPLPGNVGEGLGLAQAGSHLDQVGAGWLGLDDVDALLLIVS